MAINRFSENHLLWANRILFNSGNKVTIPTYIYQSWFFGVPFSPCALLPVHVWSQSWRCTVAFVPSLSFLSGGTLDPRLTLCSFLSVSTTWSLGPSFSRAAQVSFSSISTRCPRGSWDACHVCPHPGLSAIITGWTGLNRLPKREKVSDKLLVALQATKWFLNFPSFNCCCFFNEIVNCNFVRRNLFSSKEAVFVKMLILIF